MKKLLIYLRGREEPVELEVKDYTLRLRDGRVSGMYVTNGNIVLLSYLRWEDVQAVLEKWWEGSGSSGTEPPEGDWPETSEFGAEPD